MTKQQAGSKAPLPEYFDAESHGKNWHLFCKVCGKGWELPKTNTQAGNTLFLLNHARSHNKRSVKP